jgi:hypothetical protein
MLVLRYGVIWFRGEKKNHIDFQEFNDDNFYRTYQYYYNQWNIILGYTYIYIYYADF